MYYTINSKIHSWTNLVKLSTKVKVRNKTLKQVKRTQWVAMYGPYSLRSAELYLVVLVQHIKVKDKEGKEHTLEAFKDHENTKMDTVWLLKDKKLAEEIYSQLCHHTEGSIVKDESDDDW